MNSRNMNSRKMRKQQDEKMKVSVEYLNKQKAEKMKVSVEYLRNPVNFHSINGMPEYNAYKAR